jgi:hypothetical protein
MDKKRICIVTDKLDIARLCEELNAPTMLGGNTFDGVYVNADELREWRAAQSTSTGGK